MTTKTRSPKTRSPKIPALVTTGKEIAFDSIPVASLPAFDFGAALSDYSAAPTAALVTTETALADFYASAGASRSVPAAKPKRTNGNALTLASVYDALVSLGARTKPVTLTDLASAYNGGANVAKVPGAVYRLRQAKLVLARKTAGAEYLTIIADLPA